MVEHFCVKFGDATGSDFRDIVRISRQTPVKTEPRRLPLARVIIKPSRSNNEIKTTRQHAEDRVRRRWRNWRVQMMKMVQTAGRQSCVLMTLSSWKRVVTDAVLSLVRPSDAGNFDFSTTFSCMSCGLASSILSLKVVHNSRVCGHHRSVLSTADTIQYALRSKASTEWAKLTTLQWRISHFIMGAPSKI